MPSHVHILVPIREALGQHKIYWCRECGLVCERFGSSQVAEMVPEWSSERLFKVDRKLERYKFLPMKPEPRSENRLGKGLKDIVSSKSSTIEGLLRGVGKTKTKM
jgi:hypothetical protein